MYFKKLELYGFKSFVEKTTLIFEPGVTAIVGPNGTGKSNISDAIKWVLGEQSAKSMRGSKMEDVIFNGTESQPPVNMAEVSLTLSNKEKLLPIDYDEVIITRRLYRSGESEYLLNKTLVRLKDVHELLMGTGIGTEAYSLLEQGRIDAILSSKPEERRVVFEEASGITRYKKKKNEAMRKLEATEENLLRVNDIVVEVNRQLGSIQRQVSKARRYKEHFEQLKTLDTQYAYCEYKILGTEKNSFQEKENNYHREQTNLENYLNELTQSFSRVKETLSLVEQDYNQLNNKVISASTQIEKNSDRINLNKERIDEFTQRVSSLGLDIENANKKIRELTQQLSLLQTKIDLFTEEKNSKEHNLNLKQATISEIEGVIKTTHQVVDENRLSAVKLLSEHAQIKNELAKLSANIHNAQSRLLRLNQEKEKTNQELKIINSQLQEKASELDQLNGKVDHEQLQENDLKQAYSQLKVQIKDLKLKIQDDKQTLVGYQSQLEVLEKLNKEYEGFSTAVKTLMRNKKENPEIFNGVHDVLVNLIDVNPGFELAAETALAEYLQAVVVDNKETINRLYNFISNQKLGRVKFLMLDSIEDCHCQGNQQSEKQGFKKISQTISCQDKYKKLINFLLKNTYLIPGEKTSESQFSQEIIPDTVSGPQISDAGIVFSCAAGNAKTVEIIGEFNNWGASERINLNFYSDRIWRTHIKLKEGTYRYKFVIDNQAVTDPNNPYKEADQNGNINSVIKIITANVSGEKQDLNLWGKVQTNDRIVNINGELYSSVEFITSCLTEQGIGLISQKARMRQLKIECQNLENAIIREKQIDSEKEQQMFNLETQLNQLHELLQEEKIVLANINSEKANIESTRKKLDDELAVIDIEIDETILDEKELIEKESQKKERLKEIDKAAALNEHEMARGQELIAIKTQEREELLIIISKMKTEFSLLSEQEETLNANFSMLKQSQAEQQNNVNEYLTLTEELKFKTEDCTRQVIELEANLQALEQEKKQTETALNQISEKRASLLQEFEETQNQIKQKENELNITKNNIRDLDVKKVELNYKIEYLVNRIKQAYKVDMENFNDSEIKIEEDIDWDKQKEQIDILKSKIDHIGTVNLAAVEEEEELRERVEFLTSQKDDLLNAKQSLMQAIQKINRQTKSLFLETFEKSKVTFKEYFKLLFSGGDAQLHLTEGKDVLESGIEIIVRPPGKRLQNISLLSGGEKTLTAIALLFAIFKIKPTPFCVLDEMDAPLDESNIDRFTRVLQEFLTSSQFIIITHNKKTIAMADVMYGVTMQQPGVSKLVSVKFSEYKENQQLEHVHEIKEAALT
ncbi:MAG: chromosome segregation protein SMC [Candidatus Omnitrophota bacterium]